MPAIDRKSADRRYYFNRKLKAAGVTKRVKRGRPILSEAAKKVLVTIRIPVMVLGQIQRMVNESVAMGSYPWKTQTATINALLVRGMETLKGDPMIEEALAYFRAIDIMEGVSRHRKEAQAAMALFRTEMSAMLAIGATAEAAACYQSTHDSVSAISQNVWRDWMLLQMERAYPKLAKMQHPRIDLSSHARAASQTITGQRRRGQQTSDGGEG